MPDAIHSPAPLLPDQRDACRIQPLFPPRAAAIPGPFAVAPGHGRLAWLERAAATEALAVAAADAAEARRAADELNNLAGEPLAAWEGAAGGMDGDRSAPQAQDAPREGGLLRLTPRGRRLAMVLVALAEERALLRQRCGGHFDADLQLLERVAVRTSARNQFFGRVAVLERGALLDSVFLELPGGHSLRASVTPESSYRLGLAPGQELVALVKASATLVLGSAEGPEYADYNRLGGTVQRVASSGGRREIVIDLGHGLTGVANAGPDLAEVFAAGQSAWLAFRPSAVLLGIPG
ncbi:molybdenum transporter [Azospira sp. I13]|uniref:TOBE domain-containing protein n=1 Tax=Azospira sp. I13 TaxID=1765050 RepID=UPI000D453876|nr:TOBE domain-containing protein [Azospira sp. I13]GBG02172.1 molybdenum transporter [Azospira sp. I13]